MKKMNKILYIVLGIVIGILIVGLLYKYTGLFNNGGSTNNVIKNYSGKTIIEKNSLASSVDKAKDSVVMIEGYKGNDMSSTGTGFVYKADDKYAYVMTNEHVIDGCNKIVLVMSDDSEVEGKVLGSDEYLDLAVIRMDKNKIKGVAIISSSEKSKVGDTIFTIGTPMGYEYRGTVTSGILSGKDRMVSVSVGNNSETSDYVMKVLQIDAAVNPGNSGGPLLNSNGEVIGIVSMKLVDQEIEGMGFAIPIEYAMSHIENLEQGKEIEWPVLGISMLNVTDTTYLYRSGIDITDGSTDGVVVIDVSKGSGAARSDLQKGDIITAINKEKVKNIAYLRYELYKYKPCDTIEITYLRDKKERTTKVTLQKSK